jgi:hypothetical protein
VTSTGRHARLAVTAVVFGLLLAGSLWGTDDSFPFGPFRMYAMSGKPNGVVSVPALVGVAGGRTFRISPESVGIRRAEIEGQQARYTADPALLRQVADAYAERHPAAPALVEVRIVIRWYDIRGGRPTGRWTDETAVRWQATR